LADIELRDHAERAMLLALFMAKAWPTRCSLSQ
jgi:hypothetical protein